tara:strand:- start:983 stop:2254 length:1272 start_codon:yes stop_codon:yes gene_type:complete
MKKIIKIILVILIVYFLYCIINFDEGFENTEDLYQKLMDDFQTIFPDRNRNAGGVQFYHHIVTNMNPTIAEFKEYNKLYCGVSGSPIDPGRSQRFNNLVVKDLSDNLIYGKYYRCCWPCVCDIMKYVKTEEYTVSLSDGEYTHNVLTINDPCINSSEIPSEVTSFTCSNNNTTNGIRSNSGRLIIGVLFDPEPYDETNTEMKNKSDENNETCRERNNTDPDDLQGGMGDIFVKLSLIGSTEPFENQILNIYGQPLQKCQMDEDDMSGSWDHSGNCSETGGGVHQLCFSVDGSTENFARDTMQGSNWSLDRVNKNHCMCLGAYALYKARQETNQISRTNDELKCNAIPEISLGSNYINNWNTWNGNELSNQIVHGVNKMIEQCYREGDSTQKEYLKNKYMELVETRNEFHNTELYRSFLNQGDR